MMIRQFIKFGIIGVSNTLISYMIYIICLVLLCNLGIFQKFDYLIGSVISFLISVYWSFYWNERYTFNEENRQEKSKWKALLKTYICYSITGLFLGNILLYFTVDKIGIPKNIAPLINLTVTVPINFGLNKFWAFRDMKK